jgi:hypothetical protein
VLELHLDAGNGGLLLLELMVAVVLLRLPPLVGLGPLDGGREGVRNGRVVGELGRGDPVQRDAEAEVERLELEAGRVGGVSGTRACLA